MKIERIIFGVIIILSMIAPNTYAASCTGTYVYNQGYVNADCSVKCSWLKASATCGYYQFNDGSSTYGSGACCKYSSGTYVADGCKYSDKTITQYEGVCRLGTRKKKVTTYTAKTYKIQCGTRNPDSSNVTDLLEDPYTVSGGNWVNVSNNSTDCPKECSGGVVEYRVSGACEYEQRKCCGKGYWTDWGKTGCTSDGYVSGN